LKKERKRKAITFLVAIKETDQSGIQRKAAKKKGKIKNLPNNQKRTTSHRQKHGRWKHKHEVLVRKVIYWKKGAEKEGKDPIQIHWTKHF